MDNTMALLAPKKKLWYRLKSGTLLPDLGASELARRSHDLYARWPVFGVFSLGTLFRFIIQRVLLVNT
jgi:hypothetical protein